MYRNLSLCIKLIGFKRLLHYFFFQKILRVNGGVPWPVHWTSLVTEWDKIQVKSHPPFPGFMPGQYIQGKNGIIFGENIIVGPGTKIVSASHNLDDFKKHDKVGPIKIGDNSWIAANVTILPGVELGEHTVVAAGAVVNKSFTEGNIVLGGVPAKVIKKLNPYSG